MGFLSHRRRDVEVQPEQKWDYINLNDFKSTSCYPPFAYGYLWFSLILAIVVYGVDIFTAYQLLAFNKWSSQVEPAVPFDVSKWVFSICIILSFVNLAYEYLRAARIMRRGSVAECFLDALAARLESIRPSSGWRRFLVFAALTESKKGSEYVALFTFFSFQSWIRVLICSGPRQAINALTLYSVYNKQLQIQGDNFEASLASFFDKIKALATEEPRQAVILSGMLFTFIIWIFSFLSLLLAGLFFVFYLWGHIPREDGGLTGFCERKVNKRLKEIVAKKINKAMADEERKRRKAEFKAAKLNGEDRPLTMKPSIPVVLGGDNMPAMPSLDRTDTFASFSEKPSVPSTPGSFEMSAIGRRQPARSATMATSASQYSSKTSLISAAAEMGQSGPESPAPTLPRVNLDAYPLSRTTTGTSDRSFGPGPQRMAANGSSLRAGYAESPGTYSSETMPSLPPPALSPAGPPNQYRSSPGTNAPRDRWPTPSHSRPPVDDYSVGRASPAPTTASYRSGPLSPPPVMGPDGYSMRSATNPMPPRGIGPDGYGPPARSATAPISPHRMGPGGYPMRSATGMPWTGPDGYPPRGAPNPMAPQTMEPDEYPPRSDTNTPRLGPDGFASLGPTSPMAPQENWTAGYPVRSATNPVPPRGPASQFLPQRSMTSPMQSFHQQTGSSGSLASMHTGPSHLYHQLSPSNGSLRSIPGQTRPNHQSSPSNGSSRGSPGPSPRYHQPSASNSSLRNMVSANEPDDEQRQPRLPQLPPLEPGDDEGFGPVARLDPMTADSRRSDTASSHGGHDEDRARYQDQNRHRDQDRGRDQNQERNGWNEDLEQGPRY
ncbi:hypothetical protein VTK26DRAFT_5867 [Humicola hyalothermophila]